MSPLASILSKNKQALVSVGIPTFNRPDGLRRTLNQITGQTYKNLEIIISDNASPNTDVEGVVKDFMKDDSRIRYFRQEKNIGAWGNFKYVLARASGDYFMWAADDDEWLPEFIEACLAASSQNESIMCGFDTVYRTIDRRINNPMPVLVPEYGVFKNSMSFLALMQPSVIYGLHYKKSLDFFEELPPFDWSDCYFALHLILRGPGIRTIPPVLYAAGIDTPTYQVKYVDNEAKKLDYITFMRKTIMLCLRSRNLGFLARLRLAKNIMSAVSSWVRQHEGEGVRPAIFLVVQFFKKMNNKNPRLS